MRPLTLHVSESASGETVARVYNESVATLTDTSLPLTGDVVWHAFYLHALLLDCHRHGSQLRVPHHGSHSQRYQAVLDKRNQKMAGTGQPMWAHACDECEKILPPGSPSEPARE